MRFMGSSTSKIRLRPGLCPNPAGGAYRAPPDPIDGGKGARCPLPKNLTLAVGPSGLKLIGPQTQTKLRPWEAGNLPDQSKYGCYGPALETSLFGYNHLHCYAIYDKFKTCEGYFIDKTQK